VVASCIALGVQQRGRGRPAVRRRPARPGPARPGPAPPRPARPGRHTRPRPHPPPTPPTKPHPSARHQAASTGAAWRGSPGPTRHFKDAIDRLSAQEAGLQQQAAALEAKRARLRARHAAAQAALLQADALLELVQRLSGAVGPGACGTTALRADALLQLLRQLGDDSFPASPRPEKDAVFDAAPADSDSCDSSQERRLLWPQPDAPPVQPPLLPSRSPSPGGGGPPLLRGNSTGSAITAASGAGGDATNAASAGDEPARAAPTAPPQLPPFDASAGAIRLNWCLEEAAQQARRLAEADLAPARVLARCDGFLRDCAPLVL
jgi:hypothetical protein